MELFNWQDLGNEAIGIGVYNPRSERTELKARSEGVYQEDLKRRRDRYRAKREEMGKQVSNYSLKER